MKVAAYQAPLLSPGSMDLIESIRERVEWCATNGVKVLCCPEAVLGGLADRQSGPLETAFEVDSARFRAVLSRIGDDRVITILGFTEIRDEGLFNAAAVHCGGELMGVYRKHHPAMRASSYRAGTEAPVFTAGCWSFGVLICNDTNFSEPAGTLARAGAVVFFVPTNNALPRAKADVLDEVRRADQRLSTEHGVWVVRADVAGSADSLISHGSSAVTNPSGELVLLAREPAEDLLVVDIPAHGEVAAFPSWTCDTSEADRVAN